MSDNNNIYYNSNKINTKLENLNEVIKTLKDNNLDQYIKYNINNKKGGGDSDDKIVSNSEDKNIDAVGVVELFNKLYNIYIIYRFRFNNSANLNISFVELSNIIKKFKSDYRMNNSYDIKTMYNNNYIKEIGEFDYSTSTNITFTKDTNDTNDTNYNKMFNIKILEKNINSSLNNILFTFRQKTTHLIKDMLLTDDNNKKIMENIISVLEKLKKTVTDDAIDEIIGKSKMIKNLVDDSNDLSDITYRNKDSNVLYIRGATNHLIQLIGDEFLNRNKSDSLPILSTNIMMELFINCINKLKILINDKDNKINYNDLLDFELKKQAKEQAKEIVKTSHIAQPLESSRIPQQYESGYNSPLYDGTDAIFKDNMFIKESNNLRQPDNDNLKQHDIHHNNRPLRKKQYTNKDTKLNQNSIKTQSKLNPFE